MDENQEFENDPTEKKQPSMDDEIEERTVFTARSFGRIPDTLPRVESIAHMTPVTLGMTKSEWVKQFIQRITPTEEKSVEDLLLRKHVNFEEFKEYCLKSICKQVDALTPHTLDR